MRKQEISQTEVPPADSNMKLGRALAINIRTAPRKYAIGDKVHVWREEGVTKAHRGWSMIAKVVGKEQEMAPEQVGTVLGQEREFLFIRFGNNSKLNIDSIPFQDHNFVTDSSCKDACLYRKENQIFCFAKGGFNSVLCQ